MKKYQHEPPIDRRGFLRTLATYAGLGAISSFLQACGLNIGKGTETAFAPPTVVGEATKVEEQMPISNTTQEPTVENLPTSTPSPPPPSVPGRVAFVKTQNRSSGIRQAIQLLGVNPVSDKNVVLKPNFNSWDPTPGSTHIDVLRTLILELDMMGANGISVADRSGMGNTRAVMEKIGIFQLAQELEFDVIVLDELPANQWEIVRFPGSYWMDGFPFPRPLLEADAIVQTCCLKTHQYGGHFTMSLKNSVGLVAKQIPGESFDYMRMLHSSNHQRKLIADINLAYQPALIVMDGVEAFVSGGPALGDKVLSEVVLASTDRIAIDAVGVAILRYFGTTSVVQRGAIFEQEQIARAVELNLGVTHPEQIDIITSDSESQDYADAIRNILYA